ncbi:MAG: methyl-accepting chemotaxis protein [Oscillospiraceae bacterium]
MENHNYKTGSAAKIPFLKRIGFKLGIFALASIIFVGVVNIVFTTVTYKNVINQAYFDQSVNALKTLDHQVSQQEQNAKRAAVNMAADATVVSACEKKDGTAAGQAITNIEKKMELGIDAYILLDVDGNLITDTSGKDGADCSADVKKNALDGDTATDLFAGTNIKVGISAGTSIENAKGEQIGAIIAVISLVDNDFVDSLKDMTGNEFTIFAGNIRADTTVMMDGKRVTGTALKADIADKVITQKEDYTGKADILEMPYATSYEPITDDNGKVLGVFFSGVSLEAMNAKFLKTVMISALILTFCTLAVSVSYIIFVRKKLAEPMGDMAACAQQIAGGTLNVSIGFRSEDELGILADSLRTMVSSQKNYIGDISDKLGKIADGDLTTRVTMDYIGDFVKIKESMRNIALTLNESLTGINQAAVQVSIGASQVSDGAQALASGSTEQASAIQQLSATVLKIADQANENSANVRTATRYVKQTSTNVAEGTEQMHNLTDAMNEISDSSKQITKITKVIEDIAFQTNILALNAAVEAARAGASGKGFSVVADEVRNLAAKSAEAAKQTADLIESTVETISKGTHLMKQTAEILTSIKEKSGLVAESIVKIEVASEEQAAAIKEVRQGLMQVSDVVQNNAATAEENSATSEEMSAQAVALREEVSRFQLQKGGAKRKKAVSYHEAEDEEEDEDLDRDYIEL